MKVYSCLYARLFLDLVIVDSFRWTVKNFGAIAGSSFWSMVVLNGRVEGVVGQLFAAWTSTSAGLKGSRIGGLGNLVSYNTLGCRALWSIEGPAQTVRVVP